MAKGMEPIFTRTLSSLSYWVAFNNIPQTNTDLKLVISGRSDAASGDRDTPLMYLNADAGNATHTRLFGIPTVATGSDRSANIYLGYTSINANTANTFGSMEIYIPNYTSTGFKQVLTESVSSTNSAPAGLALMAGLYRMNTPITQLQVAAGSGNWMPGSTFTLYGISR